MKRISRHVMTVSLLFAASWPGATWAADEAPASLDDLFGDEPVSQGQPSAATPAAPATADDGSAVDAADALLDGALAMPPRPSGPRLVAAAPALPLQGFMQLEAARNVSDPAHTSKLRLRTELASHGRINSDLKWKLGMRLDYDGVFDVNDVYPPAVRRDQLVELMLRENYLDYSAGDWDFRLGRQHVVWGEMVGMFFADVVSARDMREFLLPEFDAMRIPQWALRSEYFKDDMHAELLWVPIPSYDQIGKPGAEFFPNQPQPPGFDIQYRNEVRPKRRLNHGNYGLRVSTLKNGWDMSAFYYNSLDIQPTFYRELQLLPASVPSVVYEARHDRIEQLGGTLAKDLGSVVLKAEAAYTHGRQVTVLRMTDADGVVPQDTLDWALGLDFNLPHETRFNLQFYQRATFGHDPDTVPKKFENGYSLYVNSKLSDTLEAQVMWLSSLQRNDWLFRPRLAWTLQRNWRLMFGADIFHGPRTGLFGRYEHKDRVYGEVRYAF